LGRNLFTIFISRLYRSTILRVLIVLLILICVAYYTLVLPWVNRTISEQYQQQTGHQLLHDKIDVNLFKCNFNLTNLKDSTKLWQADIVHINMACMQSLRERSLVINDISIQKLVANVHQLENAQWSFNDVILHQQKMHKAAESKKSTNGSVPVAIKKITIIDAALHSNLLVLNNLPLDASPLNFTVSNIDLRTHNLSGFSLKADLNRSANVAITGKLSLVSLSGDLDIETHNIPFVWFNSALKPYAALDVLNGVFEFHNHLNVVAGMPQRIISSGTLNGLKIRPTATEQDAVKWKSFEWVNADILLTEKSIHIPSLTLNGLDGQFIIDKNRRTNIQAMFTASAQPVNASAPAVMVEEKPWQFNVDRLAINKAAIGFYDQSLTPSFTAIVQDFTGDVINISSDENTFATINMAGNVDGYSPVSLKGKSNLFSKKPKLDALLSFKQLDMGALSPYSAEYAGWRINKGLLSADLNYHYEDGKILGKNHVVIDHLEFGEKVRGTHVIDVPLRLGLALLTDENGVAVLDTEISGAPSDPKFNVREVILRALSNTLKKIVTSPFKFLSNLLNSKEDLGKIQFIAGESQLSEAAKEKLRLLTEAMKKRPKMRLSVQGVYDTNSDLIALKEEQVKSALQKNGLAADALVLHNESWSVAVTKKYKALALTNLSATPEEKYREIITVEPVDPERLRKLAHERAQAVKQYFVLQLAVASEVILLDSDARCEQSGNCSASEVIFTLEI
jgi:hypothetical protein